jgi:antigen flippase
MIAGTIWTNFAIQAMTLATSVLAARLLGPLGRGELALVLLYPQLVAGIAFLGVDRAVAILGGRGDLRSPAATIAKLVLLFSLPAMASGYVAVTWRVVDSHLAGLAVAYLAYVPAVYFFTLSVALLNGVGDFSRFNTARSWFYGCNLFLLLAVWAAAPMKVLDWIVLANLVSVYAAFAAGVWLMWKHFRRSERPVPSDRGEMRRVLGLSLVFALPAVLANVSNSAYQILLEHWMGVRPLGLFVVYFSYSRLLAPLGSAIGSHVFHIGIAGKKVDMSRTHRQSLVIYLLCSVPLWLLAAWLIPFIFGREFVGDAEATAFLFVSSMFGLSADNLAEFVKGRGKVAADIHGRLFYLGTLAVLGGVLMPSLGLLGLALALASADALRCAYLVVRVARETGETAREFWRVSPADLVDLYNRGRAMLQGLLARR